MANLLLHVDYAELYLFSEIWHLKNIKEFLLMSFDFHLIQFPRFFMNNFISSALTCSHCQKADQYTVTL